MIGPHGYRKWPGSFRDHFSHKFFPSLKFSHHRPQKLIHILHSQTLFIQFLSILMAIQPPSSSSSFSYEFTYQVFLSFRGTDTRYGFTGNLYKALTDKGIHTFIDDNCLQRGDEITPSLLKAIEESRIFIPVFTIDYASSSFCLDELVHIIHCYKTKGCSVLPVFYGVDPTHIRHQTGSYGEHLTKHEDMERLKRWKMALTKAASLSGYHYSQGYEYKFIGDIVEDISNRISRKPLHVAKYPVGLQFRVQQVKSLLDEGCDDRICMVGLHGTGGLGKSTLAKEIYNSIADQFEGVCFLHNVRENSAHNKLKHLQEELLLKTVTLNIKLGDVCEGIPIIKERLCRKKILLILDDVDKLDQLEALAGGLDWFGPGSRVIITTRDKQLLSKHKVQRNYEVDGLNENEALELLRLMAFKDKKIDSSYDNILNQAIKYASGLPLALEVVGSNLFGKSIAECESILDKYGRIPHKDIQKILRVSYDALEEEEQSVFLDIACCFKRRVLAEVEEILQCHYGHCIKCHIGVLVGKSLLKISNQHHWDSHVSVTLHDLLEHMGKEIVRQESIKEPGERSRLWHPHDIVDVLQENTGTSKLEMVYMNFPPMEFVVDWNEEAFKKTTKLKTIIIENWIFSEGPKSLPRSLTLVKWKGCTLESLSSSILNEKEFKKMKILTLDHSQYLTHIPNMSGLPNLQKFSFEKCHNLITIDNSIGELNKLEILSAKYCGKLESFPPLQLPSLKELKLSFCKSLKSFPELLCKMENLKDIQLYQTSIGELPSSFHNLSELCDLTIHRSGGVMFRFPEHNDEMYSIVFSKLKKLKLSINSLSDECLQITLKWCVIVEELDLSGSNFKTLPECLNEFHLMRTLKLDYCMYLEDIRGIPPNLDYLSAMGCESLSSSSRGKLLNQKVHEAGCTLFRFPTGTEGIPDWFEHQIRGDTISFWFRKNIPSITSILISLVSQRIPVVFLIVNGSTNLRNYLSYGSLDNTSNIDLKSEHAYLFDLKLEEHIKGCKSVEGNLMSEVDHALLKNEWIHVELNFVDSVWNPREDEKIEILNSLQMGIHTWKEKSNTEEDVIFTNPYRETISDEDKTFEKDVILSSGDDFSAQTGILKSPSSLTYQVFLSFWGTDTRHGFTGNLYKALTDKGIHTFIDDNYLQRGDEITPSLLKAIEESRIFIPVFSINYASSSFCLDELVHIIHCYKTKDHHVLPVFFGVEPTIVRHRKGSYAEALAEHEKRFQNDPKNMERLQGWKEALSQAANLSGYHDSPPRYGYELIGEIVKYISNKICRKPLHVANYPVGLQSRVEEVISLLDEGPVDGVHMVGIYGIGGLGKSTLARAVYNFVADQFEGLCFLHDVRENSAKNNLKHLQEKLLLKTTGLKIKLDHVSEGIPIIKERLCRKKILLILDDVDNIKQLHALAGGLDWFGPGSRVIITTRDKRLLTCHGIKSKHEVEGLYGTEALELLSWMAFKSDKVPSGYEDILNRAVAYASGLPLVLEIVGSNLFGKSIEEWKYTLDGYDRIPNKEIQKILKVSYDALEEEEQSVFLDIACCFKGYRLTKVKDILHAHYGHSITNHLRVLFEKSLIVTHWEYDFYVRLHDLIEDMGKEVVRQESPKEPGERSRLWCQDDIVHVLTENAGTGKIEMICMNFHSMESIIDQKGKAFKKMTKLKTLIIENGHSEGLKYLPSSLRGLKWEGCLSKSLSSSILSKKFQDMTVLILDHCEYLTHISDVSGLANLETLSFEDCKNLITIHNSIGHLNKLERLSACRCSNLKRFPPLGLASLKELNLSYCFSLKSFPKLLCKMTNIDKIWLGSISIGELPSTFQNLSELDELYVRGGRLKFPKQNDKMSSIVFSNMTKLTLNECNLSDECLQIILKWCVNVEKLNLSENNFKILPECLSECHHLKHLDLSYCTSLEEIRGIPPNLEELYARQCRSLSSSSKRMLMSQQLHEARCTCFYFPTGTERIPDWFEHQSRGETQEISFWFRKEIPSMICIFILPEGHNWGADTRVNYFVNGYEIEIDFCHDFSYVCWEHTTLFHTPKLNELSKRQYEYIMDKGLSKNEWIYVEFKLPIPDYWSEEEKNKILSSVQMGIHVLM